MFDGTIDSRPKASLVTNALGMAIEQRRPRDGRTVIHSDQGTQFTSWAFTQRAIDSGLVPSMGSVGNCFDNAMIESFCSRLQVELLDRRRWKTRVELANAIFEYIVRDVINLRVKPVLERHDRTKAAGQSPRVVYVLS